MRPYTVTNASVYDENHSFSRRDLHVVRGKFVAKQPSQTSLIDLTGYSIVPALVNYHDHLELNHYPRTKFRDRYDNAHQWGDDVNEHLNDSLFRRLGAYSLWDRLFIGGLKNLLCGALFVYHHNPPHRQLFQRNYPVGVLRRYKWAHSFHFDSRLRIFFTHLYTPYWMTFQIHLAEGTDNVAAGEYRRLKRLGCADFTTVIVHGVGLTDADIADAAPKVRALVTCPTTNMYLLGKTANLDAWRAAGGLVCVGSDSRLTAEGDLLDEFNMLAEAGIACRDALVQFRPDHSTPVSGQSPYAGQASWLAVREDARMPIRRADLALVVRDGVPQIGDPDLMAQFPDVPIVLATLDGKPKAIHANLAKQIRACKLQEPGLTVE